MNLIASHELALTWTALAAGIGLIEVVREMLEQDPDLVRAKGGDGCHPLHFCRDRELAALLIEQGADVDACDEDHHSTPSQWRIDDAPETENEPGTKALADVLAGRSAGVRSVAFEPIGSNSLALQINS